MMTKRGWCLGAATIVFAVVLAAAPARLSAQQTTAEAVRIGDNDLGGTVSSANGPEAGVWSLPRRPICRPNSPRSSSPTIAGAT